MPLGPASPATAELLTGLPSTLAYVLPVKVEMEMVIQQYEKAKAVQDEQLERLTQICQEQGVRHHHLSFCPLLSTALLGEPKAQGWEGHLPGHLGDTAADSASSS